MDIAELKQIGLTPGEAKIYVALLELGETTRTELAKISGVSPSKIYDVANRLVEKGIISKTKKNGVLHFSPAHPSKIQDYIERKAAEIQEEKKIVDTLLPQLVQKYTEQRKDTAVEIYQGWEGMKTAFNHIVRTLGKGDTNYIFGASKGFNSKQADVFFSQYFIQKRKKGFATKIIFNEEMRTNKQRTGIFAKAPDEMRFLNQSTIAEINIYKDTVLIILLLSRPVIIRITNIEAADSFMKYFETLWNAAKA